MANVKSHIPNNLKKFRRMMGFSQKDVAQALGFKSASCISRWESGEVMPAPESIFKLSFLYSTLSDQLFGDLCTEIRDSLREKKLAMMNKQK